MAAYNAKTKKKIKWTEILADCQKLSRMDAIQTLQSVRNSGKKGILKRLKVEHSVSDTKVSEFQTSSL